MRSATAVAARMLGYWSMGDTVASHGISKLAIVGGSGGTAEDGTDRNFLETDLGRRVEAKLQELLEVTAQLLEENRTEVLAVAHALETHRTVSGDDVEAIIEGAQGPLVDGRPYKDAASPRRWSGTTRRRSRPTVSTRASTSRCPFPHSSAPPCRSPNGNGKVGSRHAVLPERPDIDRG